MSPAPLNTIWSDFGQWKVTSYGIECESPFYSISWQQLRDGPGRGWTWRQQLAEKNWSDMVSFDAAWTEAQSLMRT